MSHSKKQLFSSILLWILIAAGIGLTVGWIRYWIGYYILLQGIISGMLIPWAIHRIPKDRQMILADATFKMSIVTFFSFMVGQAIGFGLAQPWFEPIGWLMRILDDKTVESVFGIFSTGGVTHQFYANGLNGGFWVILSLIDLAFMFFFILISLPRKSVRK